MSEPSSIDISDADLSAWLDGALDEADRVRVESWLRRDADAAARARLLAADREAIRARFTGVVDEPVPDALARLVLEPRRNGGLGRWAMAAAVAGLLVAGGVVGGLLTWQWQERRLAAVQMAASDGWVRRAALAHAVYVPEKRHPVEVRAQEDHLQPWLARRTELPLRLYDLRALGFDLMGGRLVPESSTTPSAQLMYQDAGGRRVTVYLRKPGSDGSTSFHFARQGALNLFYWIDDRCAYALVGELPREQLLALAEAMARQDGDLPAKVTAPR